MSDENELQQLLGLGVPFCGIVGCENEDADQRGSVTIRTEINIDYDISVCVAHFEAIFKVLGEQLTPLRNEDRTKVNEGYLRENELDQRGIDLLRDSGYDVTDNDEELMWEEPQPEDTSAIEVSVEYSPEENFVVSWSRGSD